MAGNELTAAVTPGKQLGQVRPADANAASLYSPSANVKTEITGIVVCETSAVADSFRIFHDEDGAVYDQTTALFFDEAIAANTTRLITFERGLWMRNPLGNLAIRAATGNALTFTAYGIEHEE